MLKNNNVFLDKYEKMINKSYPLDSKSDNLITQPKEENKEPYIKPMFKPLTQEQIDDIHNRGKITPEEMVKEWNDMGLCAPGDAIGSASWRCEKFKNCQDCLTDYANQHDEYTSFFEILRNYKPDVSGLLAALDAEDDSVGERRG